MKELHEALKLQFGQPLLFAHDLGSQTSEKPYILALGVLKVIMCGPRVNKFDHPSLCTKVACRMWPEVHAQAAGLLPRVIHGIKTAN